jgi:hypothetical protein
LTRESLTVVSRRRIAKSAPNKIQAICNGKCDGSYNANP